MQTNTMWTEKIGVGRTWKLTEFNSATGWCTFQPEPLQDKTACMVMHEDMASLWMEPLN